jgi:hypothetical protein
MMGGLANPLQVIEQITCLIFIKRLDVRREHWQQRLLARMQLRVDREQRRRARVVANQQD